jgi:hypothetical protein
METAHGLEKYWSGTNQVLRKSNYGSVTCISYKISGRQKISHLPSSNSNLSLLLEIDVRPFTAELV